MRHAIGLAPWLCVYAFAASAQGDAAPSQALHEQHSPGHHEIRMQVNFNVPVEAAPPDRGQLAARQAQARRSIYELALRECEAIVDTIAEECRLDNLTVNTQPNFNPMMFGQVTANASYRVVLKR